MPLRSSTLPDEPDNELYQDQTDSFNIREPPPIFDFSAFFAPPPVADSYCNPVEVEISASLLGNPASGYQPTSDSGHGSKNVRFNVSSGRLGDYDSGTSGGFPTFFNDEEVPPSIPPPNSQEPSLDLNRWFQ